MNHTRTPALRPARPTPARRPPALLLLSLCAGSLACPPPPAAEAGDPDAGPVVEEPAPLTFTPCPLLEEEDPATACATFTVPLVRSEAGDSDARIELFVKRINAAVPSGRSVVLLMGGPGQAGGDGEGLAAVLVDRDPGLTVYLPDHRGSGNSTRLRCAAEDEDSADGIFINPGEWADCRAELVAQYGDGLRGFSTTEAAHDVRDLIARAIPGFAAGTETVTLQGFSYGTFLASRFLALHPQGASAVIFDSICAPGTCLLSQQDQWEDGVARQVFAACSDDPACAERFPSGIEPVFVDLYERIAEGHCAFTDDPAVDEELVRGLLGRMMMDAGARRLTAAVVHRLSRCSDDDRAVIARLYELFWGIPAAQGAGVVPPPTLPFADDPLNGYSFPMAINIVISEMWEQSDPDAATLEARWQDTLSCRGVSRNAAFQTNGWPRYDEPLAQALFDTDIPLLALNAALDPATPVELTAPLTSLLTREHQSSFVISGSSHTTFAQGQLRSAPTSTCGRELSLQFLLDPRAPLDTACLDDGVPFAFSANANFVAFFFGTSDLWGD